MKKILFFITQSEFGGAQRYVFDLANNLKGDFEVAVALGEQANNGKLAKILSENNIKYYIIPHLKRSISPINDILAFFEIIKLIKSYRPDIVHLNSSKISILGSIAAFVIKLRVASYELRVIYTVHGWVFNEPLPICQKWFYKFAEKFTARFKDKIICVSEFDKQIALKFKIAPENKLITIHNGLAPINFCPEKEAKKIIYSKIQPVILEPKAIESRVLSATQQDSIGRSAPSRMTNDIIIGSIGNLYKTKGYEYFIQAADILINQHHLSAAFIIIGEGEERKTLENLIAKLNLKNNFILTGRLDDAAKLLPALNLYVCSSVKEGLPYSVLEAMSAGLPIATTDVGGIPEMIEDKKTGLLVGPADPNDLAENIKTLLNNKTLATELGRRAQEIASAEFGLEKMIEATKNVFTSFLNS
ncbi:MAG: glycosyltransferase family 4 protein [bacterium]|nr:glycosyltransferase family 4 protein [bacterium]